MRILIKGGVWKNSEDEILKAAVMKYGKNAWARVASLLNRKSAKQCKARWYEWLDPSIKKTEWSRDEEERLLHLAKLMPNQWRTIAPIVGRTAAQCMDHYERLLDQAQQEDNAAGGSSSSSSAAADGGSGAVVAADDPRRLRAGEIDPAPETKPARPDPIDMDEDEKEMLSEARARLANTKGKKAKRKLRERTMADARRLALLQKRRELKAAGIESKLGGGEGGKKRKFIDYAREIPFQKVPPAGYYDVSEENRATKGLRLDPEKEGLELAKMEGQHKKQEEERQRKRDQHQMKKLFKEDAPLAVSKVAAENDPATLRRRNPLSLPSPQVSDVELEEIVKIGKQQQFDMAPPTGLLGAGATQALIADYAHEAAAAALPTPMRTPMQEDIVMQEARNARRMREMTPLFDPSLGDTAADGYERSALPDLSSGTGFEGVEPRKAHHQTPNTLLMAANRGGSAVGGSVAATPASLALGTPAGVGAITNGSVVGSGASVMTGASKSRPLRDHFGLNRSAADGASAFEAAMDPAAAEADNFSVSEVASLASTARFTDAGGSRARSRMFKEQLSKQLQQLPEPEYSYELALPELPDEAAADDEQQMKRGSAAALPDAAELRAAELAAQRRKEQEEYERRSTVLKRGLPRPARPPVGRAVVTELSKPSFADGSKATQAASATINKEALRLMQYDAINFPMATKSSTLQASELALKVDLEPLPLGLLADARSMIDAELSSSISKEQQADLTKFNQLWEDMHKNLMFLPDASAPGGGAYGVPKNKAETLTALSTQFAALKAKYDKDAKKAGKIENKLKLTTQGYETRGQQLQEKFYEVYDAFSKACVEKSCFQMLLEQEKAAAESRKQQLLLEVQRIEEAAAVAHAQYAEMWHLAQEVTNGQSAEQK